MSALVAMQAVIFTGCSVPVSKPKNVTTSSAATQPKQTSAGTKVKIAAKKKSSQPQVIKRTNEFVIINNGPDPQVVAQNQRYHQEYQQKRQRYHQEWERKQRYHQAWQQEQKLVQQRAEQQRAAQQRLVQQQSQLVQQQAMQRRQQQLALANNHRLQRAVHRSHRQHASMADRLSWAALNRTRYNVRYDGRYIPISYPNGDVPANIGVCTDTVIRSYRRLGIDLQRLVHEDMSRAFHLYPNLPKWGLSAPDPNIDHRRVLNLRVFLARHGRQLPVTRNPHHYRPGDLVTWYLGKGQHHIGLVVDRRSPADPNRYMIVHNIADGDRLEDVLFAWPITGHFRYLPNVLPGARLASAR